jgi:hypothetical protein
MSVREKGLWAQALKALDDARLRGEIWLQAGYVDGLCHVNDINVNVNVVRSGGRRA